jgi:hypothetical protein
MCEPVRISTYVAENVANVANDIRYEKAFSLPPHFPRCFNVLFSPMLAFQSRCYCDKKQGLINTPRNRGETSILQETQSILEKQQMSRVSYQKEEQRDTR